MTLAIDWDPAARQWHLRNGLVSCVLRVLDNGWLGGLHLGAPLAADRSYAHLGSPAFGGFANRLDDPVALELPVGGRGDFRVPALAVRLADGSGFLDLRYRAHRIAPGKPELPGLPSTYVEDDAEAKTLEVDLADEAGGVEVTACYTVFAGRPVVARSAVVRNAGDRPIVLETAMSASLDLPDADWELLQLSGAWARERHLVRRALRPGRQSIASTRGASGLEHNPFLALVRPRTDEEHGEAFGFSLVYSGNFLAEAEVGLRGTTRVRIGIEPESFAWTLEPGEAFVTPEAVIAWSGAGLGELSDAFHGLYRERLARGSWRDRPRPVVLNNWEATYFGFDEARLLEIARASRDLGVELVVLDDGWFGRRDDDTTSLGDWTVDARKLPRGLAPLAEDIEAMGLRFGLWIEPEMVSERSRLFEAHPDWAIGVPGRPRTESRQQLVLDLSRPEVVDHLTAVLTELLGSARISYVKWDMNRNISEPFGGSLAPDRQGEFFHRYILGVYELYRRLTEAFPGILFESCASGGGRFDPGLLAYAPQAWTSDDTDAVERLAIQWGTSLVYPLSSMAAHVSAVPNHQVGRVTPLATRAAVAFLGVFGYELDPTGLTDEERAAVREQIDWYTARRELLQFGRFVRLRGPWDGDGNETAWMVVSDDRRQAVVGWYRVLDRPVPRVDRLRLRGLDGTAVYRVREWGTAGELDRGGDELMAVGLVLEDGTRRSPLGDFQARLFDLEAS